MKELIEIQEKLNAPKGQYNAFGKYKYRSCEDILAAVKPLLKETSCILTIQDDICLIGDRYYVKATAILRNGKGEEISTTAYAREEETKKGMDGSQVTGASSSYARKYALNGLFAIDDMKDADTLNTSADYTQQQQKSKKGGWRDEIARAKTHNDLQAIHHRHPELHQDDEFRNALNDRYTQIR